MHGSPVCRMVGAVWRSRRFFSRRSAPKQPFGLLPPRVSRSSSMLAGRRCSSFTVASSRTWRHGLQRCAAVVGYGVSRCGGRTEEFLGKTSSARLIAVPPVEIVFARDPCVLPWCSLFQVVAGAAAPGEVYKPVEVGAVPRLSHSALSLRWNDTSESSASTVAAAAVVGPVATPTSGWATRSSPRAGAWL